MKTTLEIEVRSTTPPVVRHLGGDEYEIVAELTHTGNPARAVWVRSWDPDNLGKPKDGKGLSVTPRRTLKHR